MGQLFVRFAQRWMPDPFIFAILLTFLTYLVALVSTPHGALELIGFWGDGFWAFLEFGMQMCLILVTGHALAEAPPIKRVLQWLADRPQSPTQAIALVAVAACSAAWLNWGFGLIVGALLARDVGRKCREKGVAAHYPILGAAGYAGLGIWHGGLSGSAPLTVADEGHSLFEKVGVIPLTETVLTPANVVLTLLLLAVIPLVLSGLQPEQPETCHLDDPQPSEEVEGDPTPAQRLDGAPALAWAVVLFGLAWLVARTPALGLNTVNFLFLVLGMALHGSPKAYSRAIGVATSGVSGIILQFPFYAGIMGIMQSSGLIALIASGFVTASETIFAATGVQVFYLLSFLSAGLVNLFVPSGGGQWIVQGPIVVEAAQALKLNEPLAIMAIAYGDQWTNMLQPFWALPLLAITGLEARQLIGYTIPVMLATGLVFAARLLAGF